MPIISENNYPDNKTNREELRKIGTMGGNYNKVINDLIVENNLNKLNDYGEKFIRKYEDEFVSIDDI